MFPLRYKVIRQIKERIAYYDPEKVYLFGSYARNEVDDVSDIDLVVIKETHESFFDRIRNVIKILQIDRAIDILVYTPGEYEDMLQGGNAFAEMIAEEGVVIYE
ncbi:nucleotidyltransferase domain-containing protein [candidate division KSB1 bacterium]|nr:nucleotidyltransferase domain-containing protein [candidate division KSB1 bacterium]